MGSLVDILGQELSVGDFVTDGRRQFQLLQTLPSFTRQKLFACIQIRRIRGNVENFGIETFVRCPLSVKIPHVMEQWQANEIFEEAAAKTRIIRQAALRARKQSIVDLRGF